MKTAAIVVCDIFQPLAFVLPTKEGSDGTILRCFAALSMTSAEFVDIMKATKALVGQIGSYVVIYFFAPAKKEQKSRPGINDSMIPGWYLD